MKKKAVGTLENGEAGDGSTNVLAVRLMCNGHKISNLITTHEE